LDEIKKYFEENFGAANLYQIYGDRLEYFLIFQKHEAGVRLNKWLSEKGGESDRKNFFPLENVIY